MKNYNKLIPATSYLGRYLKYMDQQETASAFDFWCGLWSIAGVCGRRPYVARPRAPVHLNMYLVLIGESGIARKSTSVGMAAGLVRSVLRHDKHIGFIDAKTTPEKLDNILHVRSRDMGSAQLCISISELAVFLGTERYAANMPTLLTDLYDCPSFRLGGGTIARGECVQRDVWLSFLSASTPIWLLKTVNPNVIEGGFTSRCLFVVSNTPKNKIPWPDATDAVADYKRLQLDLTAIRKRALKRGPITLNASGMLAYRRWYKARRLSLDTFKQSFEAREDAHVLRVAALLSINDDTWEIGAGHVNSAINLIAEVKDSSGQIFQTDNTRTRFALSLDTIRTVLISRGMDPIPRHELVRKARKGLSSDELNSLLEVLHEIGAVQRFTPAVDGRGRPPEYFRGTDLLLGRSLGDQVLEKFH